MHTLHIYTSSRYCGACNVLRSHSASGPASQAESGKAEFALARVFSPARVSKPGAGYLSSHPEAHVCWQCGEPLHQHVIDKWYARFNAKGHGVTILVTEQGGKLKCSRFASIRRPNPSPSPSVAGRSGSVSAGQSWVNSGLSGTDSVGHPPGCWCAESPGWRQRRGFLAWPGDSGALVTVAGHT